MVVVLVLRGCWLAGHPGRRYAGNGVVLEIFFYECTHTYTLIMHAPIDILSLSHTHTCTLVFCTIKDATGCCGIIKIQETRWEAICHSVRQITALPCNSPDGLICLIINQSDIQCYISINNAVCSGMEIFDTEVPGFFSLGGSWAPGSTCWR